MIIYFLDTSVIIDYLRGKENSINLVDNLEGELTSSYFCLAELFEGIYRSKNKEKAKEIIINFFSGLHFICNIDQSIAEKFGQLRKDLKTKGSIIEDIDIFIAATCLVNNFTLVTLNHKHFSRIKEIKLLDAEVSGMKA